MVLEETNRLLKGYKETPFLNDIKAASNIQYKTDSIGRNRNEVSSRILPYSQLNNYIQVFIDIESR